MVPGNVPGKETRAERKDRVGTLSARVQQLEHENNLLKSQLKRRGDSDQVQHMQGELSQVRRDAEAAIETSNRSADVAKAHRQQAAKALAKTIDAQSITLGELFQVRLALEAETLRADAAEASAAERKKEADALVRSLGTKTRMIEHRDEKLALLEAKLARLEARLEAQRRSHLETQLETKQAADLAAKESEEALSLAAKESEEALSERLSTIRRLAGKTGGRPVVNRSNEAVLQLEQQAAWKTEQRMQARALDAIGEFGVEGAISEDALLGAIVAGGWLETIWESKAVWELRMRWAEELKDLLRLVWTPTLTFELRDALSISYDKLDHLRQKLSHHRVGKMLQPRPWIIDPWTNARVAFPQPIAPRNGIAGWTHLVKKMQETHGLRMDATGRVAQRSLAKTIAAQLARDQGRGIVRPITADAPLIAVLGADGTGVGKRSITHVSSSIAPSYLAGISQQNEMNLNTIATSVTDDHWAGLDEVLCGCAYSTGDHLSADSIAAEFNAINRTGNVAGVPAKCLGCFDLVAARGIRGARGRAACHCEAVTATERFSIPTISDDSEWEDVVREMTQTFPFLSHSQLRNDSHTPPEGWDYATRGPWCCSRQGCDVSFASHAEYIAARSAHSAVKADRSAEGKRISSARATLYASLHPSQQGEFEPPCTELEMSDLIVDPLHCLMLNLNKVIWKYCWGDRMTNEQRELVAEYLTKIGCPLDVRAKGDGRDANKKWFSGEAFAWFCEGSTISPGLAESVAAIMDIIYLKCPAPPPPPAAAATAAAAPDVNKEISR